MEHFAKIVPLKSIDCFRKTFHLGCFSGLWIRFWRSIFLPNAWKVSVFRVFLVHIFPHLDWIRRYIPYLSLFSPNAQKYGPEKSRIQTLPRSAPWKAILNNSSMLSAIWIKLCHRSPNYLRHSFPLLSYWELNLHFK